MKNEQTKPEKKKTNPNWGGSRVNAGRKQKYGEATKVVTVRVPLSKLDAVKSAIKYILEKEFSDNY